MGYGAPSALHVNYKLTANPFLDEKCFKTSTKHRKSQPTHSHKLSARVTNRKYSMDAISSDDDCIALSDIGNGVLYRDNARFYERAAQYHQSSRRRKHMREHHDRRYSDDERDAPCRSQSKRHYCDILRTKRRRLKPDWSSSDDDCFEVTSREELKVALNINDGLSADSSISRSTLLHKLKAIHTKSGAISDQEDTAKKKSTKRRLRHKMRKRDGSGHVAVGDGACIDERVIDDAIIDAIYVDVGRDNNEPLEGDDGVDEAVSLEEQELRLIALKSAVMKKHEARKQRQLVLSIRAYSPTDSLLTPLDEDGPCDADSARDIPLELNNDDMEDNNNMDISPASSPSSNAACQPMDMDLVSSNDDDSQGPVQFSSVPKNNDIFHPQSHSEHYMNWVYGIPLLQKETMNHIMMATSDISYNNENSTMPMSVTGQHLPVFEANDVGAMAACVVSVASEEENTLRARLIADLNSTGGKKKSANVISSNVSKTVVGANDPDADAEDVNQDESLEADCLRSLLLSSIKQKKSRPTTIASAIEDKMPPNAGSSDISRKMLDMPNLPRITSNLKEAVKRLQNKNKSNLHTESIAQSANVSASRTVIETALGAIPANPSLNMTNAKGAKESSAVDTELTPKKRQTTLMASKKTLPTPAQQSGQKLLTKCSPKVANLVAQTTSPSLPVKSISPVSPKVVKVTKVATDNVEPATVKAEK